MIQPSTIFAFDLDGTVTLRELLPLMAEAAGISEEISRLTAQTLSGDIPFAKSFRLRFEMLRHVPLKTIQDIVAATPLDAHIAAFVRENQDRCAIVTGNLDVWIAPLAEMLGCRFFSSHATVEKGVLTLVSVLDKALAVQQLRERCQRVIAIGESVGDIPMFQAADMGIAYAGVHRPVPDILHLADHVVEDGASLCRLLQHL